MSADRTWRSTPLIAAASASSSAPSPNWILFSGSVASAATWRPPAVMTARIRRLSDRSRRRCTSPFSSRRSIVFVMLAGWTISRSLILPSGISPRRVNESSISAS